MANTAELEKQISTIEKSLSSTLVPENLKPKMREKLASLKSELEKAMTEKKEEKKEEKSEEPKTTIKKRGRPKMTDEQKASVKEKKKRGRKPKSEKKPKTEYKPEPTSEGGIPDCDELLRRWKERREQAKKNNRKRKTKPVFRKISADVVGAVEKAIKTVPKADIKQKPVQTVRKFEQLRKAAQDFLKAFRSVLGEDYKATEAEKELSELESLIEKLEKKYTKA